MPKKKYSDELVIEIVDAVDAGMKIVDAAKKYGVEVNTIYTWTKKAGRPTVEAIRQALDARKRAEKFGAHVADDGKPTAVRKTVFTEKTPVKMPMEGARNRVEELEREVAMLKKLLKVYKDATGIDI